MEQINMSVIDQFKPKPRQTRREPSLGEIARQMDTEDAPAPVRPSDYAQPEVRNAVADLEQEIGKLVVQNTQSPLSPRTRDVGNSVDMQRVQKVLNNTVTAAHEDACKAVDKIVADARALVDRVAAAAEAHKERLKQGGQQIALDLESAVQVLTRTVEWVEKQAPNLHNPKIEEPTDLPNPIA
jgi:hypothetical protein